MGARGKAIAVDDLRRLVELALDHVAKEHGDVVELDHDYYWWLDPEAMFGSEPPEIIAGQLFDDVGCLKAILESDRLFNFEAIEQLASLFSYLALRK